MAEWRARGEGGAWLVRAVLHEPSLQGQEGKRAQGRGLSIPPWMAAGLTQWPPVSPTPSHPAPGRPATSEWKESGCKEGLAMLTAALRPSPEGQDVPPDRTSSWNLGLIPTCFVT